MSVTSRSRNDLVWSALILVLVVVGLIAFGPSSAQAAAVKCGDTITSDTTLHKDLLNCPNNGIVIDADNVTLDLNGHLVDGDGTQAVGCDPATEFCDEGLLALGHDGVTIKHGRVRGFANGVAVGSARHARVLGISSSKNVFFGIGIFSCARSLVRGSSSNRNLAPEGDGMGMFYSHHVRILHSSFRHNRNGPGIHISHSGGSLIKGNRFSGSPDVAVLIERSDHNRVVRNRFVRYATGVTIGPGSRNVIARNRILGGDTGIGIDRGHNNLVARNVLVRPRRTGIYLAIENPSIGGTKNVLRRNLVKGSGGDGFLVRQKDHRGLLKHNIATGAADDGFDVRSRSTKLTRNQAMRNGDLGIEAVRGVDDGGGNIARHNRDPRQCTNVACS